MKVHSDSNVSQPWLARAAEGVELTKHQILSQSGVSALAQANRADASALSLLD